MTRLKIALLAGGDSPEREIALQSAAQIEAALDHAKYDIKRPPLPVAQGDGEFVGPIVHLGLLDAVQMIGLFDGPLPCAGEGKSGGEVTHIGDESQWRVLEDGLSLVGHGIDRPSLLHRDVDPQEAVRSVDHSVLRPCCRTEAQGHEEGGA